VLVYRGGSVFREQVLKILDIYAHFFFSFDCHQNIFVHIRQMFFYLLRGDSKGYDAVLHKLELSDLVFFLKMISEAVTKVRSLLFCSVT